MLADPEERIWEWDTAGLKGEAAAHPTAARKILKSTTERISCGGSKEEAHHEEGSPTEGH